MYSNWALRSGWPEPSSAFRLTCREKPISMSSLRTLLGLIEWPMATSADASLSRLFDTHSNGRPGSPSVAGSTRRLRSSSSVASVSVNDRGPPPSRRTWPAGSGGASRSFSPRPMVLRASPVMLDTDARPPHPAARASLAANSRRPRSSRFEPSASQRCRIARKSIMQTLVARSAPPRNRPPPSHKVAWPFTANPDSLIVVAVLSFRLAVKDPRNGWGLPPLAAQHRIQPFLNQSLANGVNHRVRRIQGLHDLAVAPAVASVRHIGFQQDLHLQ